MFASMLRRVAVASLSWVMVLLPMFEHAKLTGQDITAKQVQNSIQQGIRYLRNRQNRDGRWDGHETYGGGMTALATLALLNCGLPPNDPTVDKALRNLRGRVPTKTYEISLMIMVFAAAEPNTDLGRLRQMVKILVDSQQDNGGWGYGGILPQSVDPSNSQFALLALWEAQRVGIDIPQETLKKAQVYWSRLQTRSGGWEYFANGSSGSMTCAGIGSLLITDDALMFSDAKVRGETIVCCGMDGGSNQIDLGIEWLARNFSVRVNPPSFPWWMYYMYALERVGRLSGLRLIGDHDWYREGAVEIIARQDPFQGLFPDGEDPISNTSFALLFLAKGKRQVVINRLRHGEADWNEHRRSMVHLTGHIEQAWKRDLSWQMVSLNNATVEDLLEAPVLFISGKKQIKWNANQKQLIKDYVEQGGFIFAEACNGDGCQGEAFDNSFRELVAEIFGQPLRKLPVTHPIWFAESRVDPNALPEDFWLYGLDACCRTSIVLSPRSLSCRWELSRPYGIKPNFPKSVQTDIDNAVKIGLNVVAYATGRDLKDKLDRVDIIDPIAESSLLERGMLVLPKLQHAGGADDVQRAIPNLMQRLNRETMGDVGSNILLIPASINELEKYPLVYVHGRNSFQFSVEERDALRQYLERGGFIIGDAVCASQPFTESIRKELSQLLPEAMLQPVPPDHPMLTMDYHGFDIRKVSIVDPTAVEEGGVQIRRTEGPPVLEMLVWKDRVVAVFSPYDISCALESRGALQCRGYPREDAYRIAINLVLYAMLE